MSAVSLLPVVLIHGLIGTLNEKELLERFALRRVLAPDLLGYGEHSDAAPQAIDLDSQIDHLSRVVEAVGEPRVHVVGHSIGGVVAALFARQHPGRVASLVSVEGNFTLVDAFWSAKFAEMTPDEVEEILADSRANPAGWLRKAGVTPDERSLSIARRWLGRQPGSTITPWRRRSLRRQADRNTKRYCAACSIERSYSW
jgi:lipase